MDKDNIVKSYLEYIKNNPDVVKFTTIIFVNQGDDTYDFYYDFLKNNIIIMDDRKVYISPLEANIKKCLKKVFGIPQEYEIKRVEAFFEDTKAFEPLNEILKFSWIDFYDSYTVSTVKIWSI